MADGVCECEDAGGCGGCATQGNCWYAQYGCQQVDGSGPCDWQIAPNRATRPQTADIVRVPPGKGITRLTASRS
jgi:hypothetical protein